MYFDSHAHIFYEDYQADLNDVLKRAYDAGVQRIVVPGTTVETSKEAIELSEKHDFIYACVGYHPHEASKATDERLTEIEELSKHPKVVAIGEIGLDFHYDFSPRKQQMAIFEQQIAIAIRRNLPVVVHTRESIPESIAIVRKMVEKALDWKKTTEVSSNGLPARRGVFHCFTGNARECRELFELGFFVSYPGIVTFKNSPVLETLRTIGYNHILIETDSPYLAPVPLRGKRNEPSNVVLIAQKIAEVFSTTPEEIGAITTANAMALFGIK